MDAYEQPPLNSITAWLLPQLGPVAETSRRWLAGNPFVCWREWDLLWLTVYEVRSSGIFQREFFLSCYEWIYAQQVRIAFRLLSDFSQTSASHKQWTWTSGDNLLRVDIEWHRGMVFSCGRWSCFKSIFTLFLFWWYCCLLLLIWYNDVWVYRKHLDTLWKKSNHSM